MTEFKFGDRVKVYGHFKFYSNSQVTVSPSEKETFKVLYVNDKFLRLKSLRDGRHYMAHPKQCRRLKKKAKAPSGKIGGREFFIDPYLASVQGQSVVYRAYKTPGFVSEGKLIKFIEAENQE